MGGILVVGAGQAGASVVARLRAKGYDGPLTLIGAEPVPPYQRPPLSKGYLLGDMALDRLFLRPEAWYGENDIGLRLGTPVTGIDPGARTLTLGSETLAYDHLVLATGSDPIHLPGSIGGDLGGVHTVRSLADVDAMGAEITQARHALIVGGGYIGLEAAAVARKLGLAVTLVELSERILQRVAAPETSDAIRALHAAHGVTIREGTGLTRLTGADRVTGAELSDGTRLDIDLAVVGIGIRPATALAETAGIALDNGIATDAQGQTSMAGIWAAGDCASFPWGEGRLRLESVQNAIDQAETVADNILGAQVPYRPYPWFWSDQYQTKLQIAGLNTGYTDVVVRSGADDSRASHWYFAGDRLLAVDAMNEPRAYMVGKRLIEMGLNPDRAAIADPNTDLKALLKA